MKLQAGCYYKRRDGQIVGPIIDTKDGSEYPFEDDGGFCWTALGLNRGAGIEHLCDLIEQVPNPNETQDVSMLSEHLCEMREARDAAYDEIEQLQKRNTDLCSRHALDHEALGQAVVKIASLHAEIERLRAEVAQLENNVAHWFELSEKGTHAMQENTILRARVEHLELLHLNRDKALDRERKERDTLKKRVEELETAGDRRYNMVVDKCDELRSTILKMERVARLSSYEILKANEERDSLREQLTVYEPTEGEKK